MRQKTDRKSPKQPLSLRQRLILALMIPLLVILATSSVFDYRLAKKTANRAHDQSLADNVYDLAEHLKRQLPSNKLDLAEESEAMLRSNAPDMLYFSLADEQGHLLAGDADLPKLPTPRSEQIEFFDGSYRGQAVRMASHLISTPTQKFQIVVVETTKKREQASSRILTAMVVPNLAVILATLLAVLFGVRQGLLPLAEVEWDIASRSASDLHEIDLSATPAELRPMLGRLNELFALVRESINIQQRFIADAAHQLRTPLAGLQMQLDLANTEGVFNTHPERIEAIEEATSRLGHLLNQLLAYAKTEASGSLKDNFESIDLELQLGQLASTFLDSALAKNIDLGFELEEASVNGLPWMLQEAFSNLIDNAIRYTPAGGTITVSCGIQDDRSYFSVDDSGPGIPEEHMKSVFQRFYRIPGSPGHGCGLGLSIVREIAELHRSSVVFSKSQLGGLQAKIVFA